MSGQAPAEILWPGLSGYEMWKLGQKGGREPVGVDAAGKSRHLLCVLPTRAILSMPLWISPQGDASELAELEFASRHLTRKNSRVYAAEIERGPDRVLILGLLVSDDYRPPAAGIRAKRFDAPARLLGASGADLVFWREEGRLCYAFFRGGHCVYFSQIPGAAVGREAAGAVSRVAMRLVAEEVLEGAPARALLCGDFSPEEVSALAAAAAVVEMAEMPPPRLPSDAVDLAPASAVELREKKVRVRRVASLLVAGGAIYLAVLAVAGALWWYRANAVSRLSAEWASLEPRAEAARKTVERWRTLRPAVDPSLFAIDQLAAVARALPGDNVRLTQLVAGGGKLTISGEASEVAQTYEMLEKLKADPKLAEYEWTARPPDIAAKNTIRFEIEGRRPDATADSD